MAPFTVSVCSPGFNKFTNLQASPFDFPRASPSCITCNEHGENLQLQCACGRWFQVPSQEGQALGLGLMNVLTSYRRGQLSFLRRPQHELLLLQGRASTEPDAPVLLLPGWFSHPYANGQRGLTRMDRAHRSSCSEWLTDRRKASPL